MRKIILLDIILGCIILALLAAALHFLLAVKVMADKPSDALFSLNNKMQPNHVGEKIIYDVKLGRLYLGQSRFTSLQEVEINGRKLSAMLLETKLTRFSDTEKIYSDPQTLFPVMVERNILNWFRGEKITEVYDQDNFTVTIVKNKGKNQQKMVIKKNEPIHNAVLLPYYIRRIPVLETGQIIIANLPTRRLEIKLVSQEEIKVPAGIFQAYHFSSTPKQIDIWISADERRIPVKIEGAGLLGYSVVMKEYSF
jgi:acyl-CoA synthetase (AMP-forming)/AMP-acid ligase II